jgi:hypothetical protein
MHESNAKQVIHNRLVLEADINVAPCNARISEFLVEYDPNQQTYLATGPARKIKRPEPAMFDQGETRQRDYLT